MAERFIKLIPSKTAMFLVTHKNIAYQNAFRLLTIIAEKARRHEGHPDGLGIGQCELGDWKSYGMTEQNYRSAKKVLIDMKLIKVIETNRGPRNATHLVTTLVTSQVTTQVTTRRTIVKLTGSEVYDINISLDNDLGNDLSNDLSNRQVTTSPQRPIRIEEIEEVKRKEKLPKRKAVAVAPSAFATQLVDTFYSSLLSAIPDFPREKAKKTKAQFQAAERLGKIVNEDFNIIKSVIAFAHQSGGFWLKHVHSVTYLEKKFMTLREQLKEPKKSSDFVPNLHAPKPDATFQPKKVMRSSDE